MSFRHSFWTLAMLATASVPADRRPPATQVEKGEKLSERDPQPDTDEQTGFPIRLPYLSLSHGTHTLERHGRRGIA